MISCFTWFFWWIDQRLLWYMFEKRDSSVHGALRKTQRRCWGSESFWFAGIKQFPWVSGTWADLYWQNGMWAWNTRHTCLRPLLLMLLLPGTFLSSYLPRSSFRFLMSLSKWCLKIAALSIFRPLCPSPTFISIYAFFLLRSTLFCVMCYLLCLLYVAAWGPGLLFCSLLCPLPRTGSNTTLDAPYIFNVVCGMNEWLNEHRNRGELGIPGWGNGVRTGTERGHWREYFGILGYELFPLPVSTQLAFHWSFSPLASGSPAVGGGGEMWCS